MKKILFSLFLLLCLQTLLAQDVKKAFSHFEAEKYDLAASEFEQIINSIENETKAIDYSSYAFCLTYTAISCERNNQIEKAINYYLKAQSTYIKNPAWNIFMYSAVLKNLGQLYLGMGRYEEAESLMKEAIRIDKSSSGGNQTSYCIGLINLASIYQYMGQYEKAETFMKEAMPIAKEYFGENHPEFGRVLNNLAQLYKAMGRYEQAETLMKEAIRIHKVALGENHYDFASTLNNLGALYQDMGRYEQAELLMKEAIRMDKASLGENHPSYGRDLNNLASLYQMMSRHEQAEPLMKEAMQIDKEYLGENHPSYGIRLNNLAQLYQAMGRYEEAEPLMKEAMRINKEYLGENHPSYSIALSNLSQLYLVMGRYEEAEQLMKEVIRIDKASLGENHPSYGRDLNNMAQIYLEMGRYEQAEPLMKEATQIDIEYLGENHPSYGIRLNNLAQLYQAMGRYEEAEQLMKEVIRIDKASLGENNPSYGRDLNNLASLYQMTSRHEQAEPLMKEAMQIDKEYLGENHPSYGIRLNNLAQLYQAMGRYIEAEALMKEAIHVAKESLGENSNAYGNGLTNLTRLYQAMGLYEKAEPLMNDAYSILKSNLRNNSSYLSENELYQFQNKVIFNLEIYQSINYQSTLSGNVDGAFATNIELYQKNLLLNSVIETRKCIFISGDTSLINSYQTIMSMRKQADKLYSMPIEQRYEDPVVLVEQANNLEKDLRLRSKEYNRSLEDAEIAWKQVQNNLKPYEISIEFVSFAYYNKYWTDSTMYCALILKKGMEFPEMVPLFEQKQLDSLLFGSKIGVNNLYASRGIKSTYIPQLPNGRKLYNLIWKPLEKELRDVKTVYYSPSGLLHQIAFAALPLDSTTYLCDTFNLVQLSSTRQLATSVWQTKPEQITSTALFGGIKYDLDVQETTELKRLLPKNDLALSRGFTSDSTLRSKPYDSLPGTRKEVESIAVMLQASNIKTALYTGISGNEEVFKSLSNQNVSVLHIATHGFFYPDEKEKPQDLDQIMLVGEQKFRYVSNPLRRSGLILAGGNRTWKGEEPVAGMEDGILTAQEISEMNLQNTELVVLSACETGLGDIKGGEGVFGLQRAFKLAGVRTIIMSLWKVDDDATKELMKSFYEKWLGGMDKHDAFRLAKKELKSKHPEPYFWAGFVMLD